MTAALTLRRPRVEDAGRVAALMADPSIYAGLLQMPFPSEAAWRQRFESAQSPDTAHLHLLAEREGEVLGMAGLHPDHPSPRRAHTRSLGLWVAPQHRGQGVARALMQGLVDYADNWLGVLRLELTVYTDNPRAIALYEHFGFEREGLHRGYGLRDGVYVDALAMARWHPKPPQRG